ncbi:MAG TPA: ABC transporter permease [Streptosporangiaceae bacterium]
MTAPAAAPAAPAGPGQDRPGRADRLAGVRELIRLAVRRDRVMLPVWVYLLAAVAADVTFGLEKLYPTPAARQRLTLIAGGNPALAFLYGQLHGSSLGALTAWRYATYAALGAGLMTIFLVIRHTRADEQAGRLELAGSAAVGRPAPLTAGLAVAAAASAALVVLTVVVLALFGLPFAGCVVFALAAGGCGLVFAALAAVAAQVAGTARGARGLAITVLAAAFLLRGIADSAGPAGPAWLCWLSPIGWAELTRPFAAARWLVLLLPAAATVGLVAAAYWLASRRDQGAGLIAPRPGPPVAGALLHGPLGLAWRLHRGALAAWAAGLLVEGLAVGAAAQGVGSLLSSSSVLRQAFQRIGGQQALTSAYLAGIMSLAGLAVAGYAVSAVLRLHAEEAEQRADPVLVAPVGRVRWAASHLLVAAVGTALLLAVSGVATGLGYGLRAGDPGTQVVRMLGSGVALIPAVLAVAAVAALLAGIEPRAAVGGGWAALALIAVLTLFGRVIQASHWVLDISPFSQVPRLPGGDVRAVPLAWVCGAALALAAAGLAGLRRRDIG